MSSQEAALSAVARAVIEDAGGPPGVQLYGSVNRSCLGDVAMGATPSGPITSRTLHALWCQVKPVVAMAAARLAEVGGWAPDTTLAEMGLHHGHIPVKALTLADVLSHRTGFGDPEIGHVKTIPPEVRKALFLEVGGPEYPARPSSVYSEYPTWEFLAQFIEQRTGRRVVDYLQHLVDLYGIEDLVFRPSLELFESWESRVGCYYSVDRSKKVPFLHDFARSYAHDFLAGGGGYATMRALGTWYEEFLDVLRGRMSRWTEFFPTPGYLHELITRRRGQIYDQVLDGHVDFAAGLLCGDLSALAYGPAPAEDSMGQFGWSWSSWTLVDPTNGIVLCALVNGVSTVRGRWDDARRRTVDTVYGANVERIPGQ